MNDVEAASVRDQIKITGLWQTKFGHKIATMKVPLSAAKKLDVAWKGWTLAKIRPRIPDLEVLQVSWLYPFFHQMHGSRPLGMCRRCGGSGHLERGCADVHKCVACEKLGIAYPDYRTGSSRCEAR